MFSRFIENANRCSEQPVFDISRKLAAVKKGRPIPVRYKAVIFQSKNPFRKEGKSLLGNVRRSITCQNDFRVVSEAKKAGLIKAQPKKV